MWSGGLSDRIDSDDERNHRTLIAVSARKLAQIRIPTSLHRLRVLASDVLVTERRDGCMPGLLGGSVPGSRDDGHDGPVAQRHGLLGRDAVDEDGLVGRRNCCEAEEIGERRPVGGMIIAGDDPGRRKWTRISSVDVLVSLIIASRGFLYLTRAFYQSRPPRTIPRAGRPART
jgi:hypothetical protein